MKNRRFSKPQVLVSAYVLSLIFFLALSIDAKANPNAQWKVIHQEEGLNILEKEDEGADLVTFKGDGVLNAPLVRVAGVLLNHDRTPKWVDSLKENRVVKFITPNEYIEYSHVGTPIILKDRDFVVKTKLNYDAAAGKLVVKSSSVEDPAMPQNSYVRGEVQLFEFTLQSIDGGKRTQMSAEVRVDPKGSIPKWLVNLFQRNWPRNAFYGIKKELAREEYKFPDRFRQVFALAEGVTP